MRELSVQSANDTNTTEQDRLEIQKEVDQLAEEITRVSTDTEFNTQSLLNGDFTDKTFHIGANADQSIEVSISNMSAAELGVEGEARAAVNASGSIQGIDITSANQTNYRINIVQGDAAASAGASVAVDSNDSSVINVTLSANESTGKNATLSDVASALADMDEITSATVDTGVATGTDEAIVGSANLSGGQAARVTGQGGLYVADQTSANSAITTIDAAINKVSAERSKLGAVQNRLDHTINNLGTSAENLTAAESRIRDVDMAKEMMEFTKNNILSQAAQSMLAQAQQQPQGVLQLLQ
ncbi:flagellin [Oceanobacillus kapialis]|uniref:flagellin n=1 Tax=Oceanobacillus kapialis TaxID=481353 RepID=UPI00385161E3